MVSTGPGTKAANAAKTKARSIKSLDDATPIQAAVLADLILGKLIYPTSQKYGIDFKTCKRWAYEFGIKIPPQDVGRFREIPDEGTVILAPGGDIRVAKVQNPSNDRRDSEGNIVPMGQQLLELLGNALGALNAQALVASNPAWIERQSGSELAAIHRAISDTAQGLAAAATAGQQRQAEFDQENRIESGDVVDGNVSPGYPGGTR